MNSRYLMIIRFLKRLFQSASLRQLLDIKDKSYRNSSMLRTSTSKCFQVSNYFCLFGLFLASIAVKLKIMALKILHLFSSRAKLSQAILSRKSFKLATSTMVTIKMLVDLPLILHFSTKKKEKPKEWRW